MVTWLNASFEMRFRLIGRLTVRFAASEDRADHALLLSPWPESLLAFEPVWWRLAQRTHLVAVDPPGFGHSQRSDSLRDRRPADRQARGRSEQPAHHRRARQRRTCPAERAILWEGCGRVVAGGACLAMASGTLSADLFESAVDRSPEPAVLFYATDDDRAGEEVERLIRTAGFEPVKAGGLGQSGRLEVGGDLHDLVVGPAQARSLIDGT